MEGRHTSGISGFADNGNLWATIRRRDDGVPVPGRQQRKPREVRAYSLVGVRKGGDLFQLLAVLVMTISLCGEEGVGDE